MSSEVLQLAREALGRGERIHARKLARQALLGDPHDEQAWLLMARVVDEPQQVIDCLQHALQINPQNLSTVRALRALRRQSVKTTEPASQIVRSVPQAPSKPVVRPELAVPTGKKVGTRKQEIQNGAEKVVSPRRAANLSLMIGSVLVLLVIGVSVFGPFLAPADPLEENVVIKVDEVWHRPPFPAFTVPGFPLGSDEFGRDLFSRILWGVRPTLSMVAVVAVVRLALGTLIGLGAGWFNGRLGRWLDTFISAALAVPVLMVALGAIAMLGAEIGLMAFIVGLSINGWGETARIVRDQTQVIKSQVYVEAGHALGASTLMILRQHVLRQIMPMVWMLFAFEISNTLMATAGLGFLGYFLGGDVWIEVSDYLSRRVSGTPELGQMLATSWINLVEPWPLVVTGSVVFVSVLGFNLMGEGLRLRLYPEFINRNSLSARLSRWLSSRIEEQVTYPFGTWLRRSALHPVMVGVTVVGLTAILYGMGSLLAGRASQSALTVPGGHTWVAERGDPYGSRSSAVAGPVEPSVLWTIQSEPGFSGGPVIAADGTLYLATLANKLLAIDPNGATVWEADLPETPIGSLALAPDGTLVIADQLGGIHAVSPSGVYLWGYQAEANGRVKHSPIVSSAGVIYFLMDDQRGDTLFALSRAGELLWSVQTGTRAAETSPRLSPAEDLVFVKDAIVNAADGSLIELTLPSSEDVVLSNREQYVVGGDGEHYLNVGHYIMQWQLGSTGFEIVQSADWNYHGAGFSQYSTFPVDAGVTRNGNIWLFYSAFYGGTTVIWLDPTGVSLGTSHTAFSDGAILVAVDGNNSAYVCGQTYFYETLTFRCQAFSQGREEPTWEIRLAENEDHQVIGAALAPGRLYITSSAGILYAIGDVSEP